MSEYVVLRVTSQDSHGKPFETEHTLYPGETFDITSDVTINQHNKFTQTFNIQIKELYYDPTDYEKEFDKLSKRAKKGKL